MLAALAGGLNTYMMTHGAALSDGQVQPKHMGTVITAVLTTKSPHVRHNRKATFRHSTLCLAVRTGQQHTCRHASILVSVIITHTCLLPPCTECCRSLPPPPTHLSIPAPPPLHPTPSPTPLPLFHTLLHTPPHTRTSYGVPVTSLPRW